MFTHPGRIGQLTRESHRRTCWLRSASVRCGISMAAGSSMISHAAVKVTGRLATALACGRRCRRRKCLAPSGPAGRTSSADHWRKATRPTMVTDGRASHRAPSTLTRTCERAGGGNPGPGRKCSRSHTTQPYHRIARARSRRAGAAYVQPTSGNYRPTTASGGSMKSGNPTRTSGFAVTADEGQPFGFLNTLTITKVGSDQCHGQMSIVDHRVPPGFAPPPHLHHHSDEALLVLDGQTSRGSAERRPPMAGRARLAGIHAPRDPASEHREPIMSAYPSRRRTCPHAAARLSRITAALAVVAGGVLAWAAAVPAASASIIPVPGDGPDGPVPAPAVRVITAGGMPGWQITLIALAAALVAATAAVVLDRVRVSHRSAVTG